MTIRPAACPTIIGWRWLWAGFAVACAVALIPATRRMLRHATTLADGFGEEPAGGLLAGWRLMLRDRRFLLLLPCSLFSPFVVTALML